MISDSFLQSCEKYKRAGGRCRCPDLWCSLNALVSLARALAVRAVRENKNKSCFQGQWKWSCCKLNGYKDVWLPLSSCQNPRNCRLIPLLSLLVNESTACWSQLSHYHIRMGKDVAVFSRIYSTWQSRRHQFVETKCPHCLYHCFVKCPAGWKTTEEPRSYFIHQFFTPHLFSNRVPIREDNMLHLHILPECVKMPFISGCFSFPPLWLWLPFFY